MIEKTTTSRTFPNPKITLLDEPTSALDPEMVNEVLPVMTEFAGQGMTMLCVTHEVGFARGVADRVVCMDPKPILEDLPVQDSFDLSATERARDFLSRILTL